MKEQLLAVYERESTLWKNANGFYHAQDWTKMECIKCDFSEELEDCRELGIKWMQGDEDVTDREIERRYGKPYLIRLINKRRTNDKGYRFKTPEEANSFLKEILTDKILRNFRRVK